MRRAPNLTPEQGAFIKRGEEIFAEAENLPSPSAAFQAKTDDQTLTNAALARDSSVHDRVMGMPHDEFVAEFDDVINLSDEDRGGDPEP